MKSYLKLSFIPNLLTGVRIFFAFLFPLLGSDYWITILTLGLLTEYLDGSLARKYNWVSASGQILDPLADRMLAFSVGMTLVVFQSISLQQLLLVLIRDIVVSCGLFVSLFFMNTQNIIATFKPNLLGKITTVLQYLFYYDVLVYAKLHHEVYVLVVGASAAAAIVYGVKFFLRLNIARAA